MEVAIDQLKQAVKGLHSCHAEFVEAVAVSESFEGQPVWEGIVHVFSLTNHPTADRAYAWSEPIEGSSKRKFFAVLHDPPIESATDAVRASIVQQFKSTNGEAH